MWCVPKACKKPRNDGDEEIDFVAPARPLPAEIFTDVLSSKISARTTCRTDTKPPKPSGDSSCSFYATDEVLDSYSDVDTHAYVADAAKTSGTSARNVKENRTSTAVSELDFAMLEEVAAVPMSDRMRKFPLIMSFAFIAGVTVFTTAGTTAWLLMAVPPHDNYNREVVGVQCFGANVSNKVWIDRHDGQTKAFKPAVPYSWYMYVWNMSYVLNLAGVAANLVFGMFTASQNPFKTVRATVLRVLLWFLVSLGLCIAVDSFWYWSNVWNGSLFRFSENMTLINPLPMAFVLVPMVGIAYFRAAQNRRALAWGMGLTLMYFMSWGTMFLTLAYFVKLFYKTLWSSVDCTHGDGTIKSDTTGIPGCMRNKVFHSVSNDSVAFLLLGLCEVLIFVFFFGILVPVQQWALTLIAEWAAILQGNPLASERALFHANLVGDGFRYLFGRQMFLKVNNYPVLAALLLKELVYHLYTFGLQFNPAWMEQQFLLATCPEAVRPMTRLEKVVRRVLKFYHFASAKEGQLVFGIHHARLYTWRHVSMPQRGSGFNINSSMKNGSFVYRYQNEVVIINGVGCLSVETVGEAVQLFRNKYVPAMQAHLLSRYLGRLCCKLLSSLSLFVIPFTISTSRAKEAIDGFDELASSKMFFIAEVLALCDIAECTLILYYANKVDAKGLRLSLSFYLSIILDLSMFVLALSTSLHSLQDVYVVNFNRNLCDNTISCCYQCGLNGLSACSLK